jgi:hypothetical protein
MGWLFYLLLLLLLHSEWKYMGAFGIDLGWGFTTPTALRTLDASQLMLAFHALPHSFPQMGIHFLQGKLIKNWVSIKTPCLLYVCLYLLCYVEGVWSSWWKQSLEREESAIGSYPQISEFVNSGKGASTDYVSRLLDCNEIHLVIANSFENVYRI